MKDLSLLQRFRVAVETLATGKGDVRSRLEDVVPTLIPIQAIDLPPIFRKEWADMWARLSEREPEWNNDSRTAASLRKMKNKTGQKFTKLIYDISKHLEKM